MLEVLQGVRGCSISYGLNSSTSDITESLRAQPTMNRDGGDAGAELPPLTHAELANSRIMTHGLI